MSLLIAEMRAVDGRQRIFLKGGAGIPLSRGYREALDVTILDPRRGPEKSSS